MNVNRTLILVFSLVILSCGTQPVKIEKKSGDITNLEGFFKRSENDSIRAGKVIEKHRIIQHLTHLWTMDRGGKKYYLLEKDDITEMINSVTEGVYLDYILINKNGIIIYTRRNDTLFGANVNNGIESAPLRNCFTNRGGVYFEDTSVLAASLKIHALYVSSPVYVENNFHGVLVLLIDVKKISEMLEPGTDIFSRDGIFRITGSEEKLFSRYPGFDSIDFKTIDDKGIMVQDKPEGRIKFSKFSYKELNWILMKK